MRLATRTRAKEYHGLAVTALRRVGRDIDDAVLAHIWPTHHENIHFYGTHSVDVDGELAKLDSDGYRPLRLPPPRRPHEREQAEDPTMNRRGPRRGIV